MMNPYLPIQLANLALNAARMGDGFGDLPPVSSYVLAGTVIAWGGNPKWNGVGSVDLAAVEQAAQVLRGTGRFSSVRADKVAGWLNPYYSLTLTSSMDRGALEDVLRDIEGAFWQIGADPGTGAFYVQSVPFSAAGRDDIASAGTGYQPTPTSSSWSLPSWNLPTAPDANQNFLDQLAGWLGVTPTQAAIVGALGAVVAIVAIKRAL